MLYPESINYQLKCVERKAECGDLTLLLKRSLHKYEDLSLDSQDSSKAGCSSVHPQGQRSCREMGKGDRGVPRSLGAS